MEKYAVVTPPETSPLDGGAAVQAETRIRGLGREQVVHWVCITKPWNKLAHAV
jgi:hypothetical protein